MGKWYLTNAPHISYSDALSFQERGGAQDVLDAIDSINIHMLPFFAQTASTGECALAHQLYNATEQFSSEESLAIGFNRPPILHWSRKWQKNVFWRGRFHFVRPTDHWQLSKNGWPSVTSEGVQPNSPDAVADVQNEHVRAVRESFREVTQY